MPSKSSQPFDWYRTGIVFAQVASGLTFLCLAYVTATGGGDRIYNMYLHSLRKQAMPNSKPTDASPLGVSWNDLNQFFIMFIAGLMAAVGVLSLLGKKLLAGLLLVGVVLFMVASKDNIWLTSDVSAIKRDQAGKLDRFFRAVSLLGVALMLISGFGDNSEEEKAKKRGIVASE
mmetsp:Transcript_3984/g.5997  ORF Transcript_3984/g.5997 Transcript_3984/m.5997 type:complete len:174 (-) Transcript_3984:25-546(-)